MRAALLLLGSGTLISHFSAAIHAAERRCTPLAADERLSVDLADAPLLDVARLVSCALDKNLLFQPASLGERRVTVLAPRPIGRLELLQLWHALLAEHALVEERHGAFEVIRPVRGDGPDRPAEPRPPRGPRPGRPQAPD
jgi:hypothetical protein